MKNKIIGLVSLILFSACSDFLELKPISESSSANFYKNANDIESALYGAYASLQANSMYREYFITLMEVRSDNVEDKNPGGSAGVFYNIDKFTARGDNTVISNAWAEIYNHIFRLNSIISQIDVVSNAELRIRYESEARFLRGLAYFNVVRLWGAAPLILKPISTQEAESQIRNSVSDIYAAIEDDLVFAKQLASKYSSAEAGRATSGAAIALLGKVYLTQGKFPQAASVLEDLTTNYTSVYGLESTPQDVFNVDNKLNKEVLFAVCYSKKISGEGANAVDAFTNKFGLDNAILSAYEATDLRADLLTYININAKWTVKKYGDYPDATTGQLGFDFPVLRYADALLMYAEALNEVSYKNNVNSPAFTALNAVRNRAKATPYTVVDLPDQQSFRKAVWLERRLELPLENHRWFDLLRTGEAITAMAAIGQQITSNDLLYPIPESEVLIMNDPVGFSQNPGYGN